MIYKFARYRKYICLVYMKVYKSTNIIWFVDYIYLDIHFSSDFSKEESLSEIVSLTINSLNLHEALYN